MSVIDITQSQGTLVSWKHQMNNSYLGVQTRRKNVNGIDAGITVGQDILAASPFTPGGNSLSLRTCTSSNQTAITQHFYMGHNNVYRAGDPNAEPLELPVKEYIQLVPPPTSVYGLAQDLYCQVVFDAKMDLFMSNDPMMSGSSGTVRNKAYLIPKDRFRGDSNVWFNGNPASAVSG